MDSLDAILKHGGISLSQESKDKYAKIKNDWYLELVNKMTVNDILPGVEIFLKENFVVIDDCPTTELNIEIKKIGGTCNDTRYTVKPIQDTGCAAGTRGEQNIVHLNPLDGTAEEVRVYLDESPPSITCGFNHAPHVNRNNSVSTNGKTLYHRLGDDSVGSRMKLNNAEFFYTVNVSSPLESRLCCSE
jgi:hypothetical protein